MLNNVLRQKFLQALMSVPSTESFSGRLALLNGLPPNIVSALNRDASSRFVDLSNLVPQLDALGHITSTGERPLIIVAQNALSQVEHTQIGETLKYVIDALEKHYGSEQPSDVVPAIPEILVFEERDERLDYSFIQRAELASRKVARLYVRRCINGQLQSRGGFGTGWLITPNLMVTNYHVVSCCNIDDLPIDYKDLDAQVKHALVWFDYYVDGGARIEYNDMKLVAYDSELDYAVMRLNKPEDERGIFPVLRQVPTLEKGDRLNIIQYPRGGPLRYAIRNNYYVGDGGSKNRLRYLTDTEPGSSGSPVLDEMWQVVGLHRGYQKVPLEMYKGEIVRYHNEGITVSTILDHLPSAIVDEIAHFQNWK